MKKLMNDPKNLCDELIDGYVRAFPDYVRRLAGTRIVLRARPKSPDQVAMLIGNGAGHEPIAMGWVGQGMLDGNVLGDIFAAPGPEAILEGIKAVCGDAGVLLLVSHHAGDLMNATLALDLAQEAGLKVEPLLMYDDISSAPKGQESQRRGTAGTTFIYKIVGARAEEGASLQELKALGERVRDNTRTLSVALAPGTSPFTGQPMFQLGADQMAIGMGVHGEAGKEILKFPGADQTVRLMAEAILTDLPFKPGDQVLALVNGAGSTTLMELLIAYRALDRLLEQRGISVYRPLVGSYVTTQEMAGMAIALCRSDAEMRRLWDAPGQVPYFHR
ncbi:MAG: dihydroxyacetone kinase subunit DhaK [Deinococcus sp.]|nr:dihydroxyacetone kinase subunit DhaK [Deinococcus sp.]